MKTLMLVLAHPDDESFLTGGTIAKYAKSNWRIVLVCATRGDAGEKGPYEGLQVSLGEMRTKELVEASQILGISEVIHLDYKDGRLSDQTPGEIEDKLYKKFEEVIPDIVITFEPLGVTNHPDHSKLSLSTTYAFQKYAKRVEEALPDLQEVTPKLYYVGIPHTVASFLVEKKVLSKESFGKQVSGIADKRISTVIDISRFSEVKRKALLVHVTQRNDVDRFFSISSNPLMKYEYFYLRFLGTKETFMGKEDSVSNHL